MTSVLNTEVIGLIPAGGYATRMGMIPCSKEILPLELSLSASGDTASRPVARVACSSLLEAMHAAGVGCAYVILRTGKWDIPAYLGDGNAFGLSLAYLVGHHPRGVPFTLDSAYPFVRRSVIALGFPDIVFEPVTAIETLLDKLGEGGTDLVLGLFPYTCGAQVDMVETDSRGRVMGIEIKRADSTLRQAWVLAVWTPRFGSFLHEFVEAAFAEGDMQGELHLGHVFQAALAAGWDIGSVFFPNGWFRDIGSGAEERKSQDE